MPDVYASIETADDAVQERLAEVLELRAADAAEQAMLEDYLADLPLGDAAAGALKAEARRRVTAGEFFGHIAYASLIATRR
jgi:hypothetical protein